MLRISKLILLISIDYMYRQQLSDWFPCCVDFVIELNFIEVSIQFIGSMIGLSSPTASKVPKRRSKEQKIVYKLTKTASMKFRPQNNSLVQPGSPTGLFQRIRSLSRFVTFGGNGSLERARSTSKEKVSENTGKTATFDQLTYLFILDADSYLIGNKTQLDAISLTVLQDYIEAEHLWTFKFKSPIMHLLVDSKRKSIVAVVEGHIRLFGYERKSKNPPQLLKQFKLLDEVKIIQFAKDSLLAVFFQNFANFYTIDGVSSRQFSKKDYKVSKDLTLYRAADCVEGILNLFFTCPKENKDSPKILFTLWCLSIDLSGSNCEIGEAKSVYDVQEDFRENLKVESINRDCFLINLGKEIYMFKKGYCVDKVVVNNRDKNTILKYFSDRKLVHVSLTQFDFYNVVIDLVSNPPKLQLKSTDSNVIPERKGKYLFMDVLRFEEHKIGFFYQISSPNLAGEVKYEFVLTSLWNYEQKINSLLPKVNSFKGERTPQNPQFQAFMQLIEHRCDSVGKMGMSRKEAYLHIWKESGKSSVQEFKLLLDTLDYNTVREQITLKLKSKSMLWVQVHKIEQGCLGMLSQPLFSQSSFTPEGLKNYLISHLLIRKLQMFKETKLYQKKAGKIKQADLAREGDKLMTNIQQYTNIIQMDIKLHLLEMIYNIIKFKKDYVTEIRILIRKFKFGLRHIYTGLIKDIVTTAKEQLYTLLLSIPQILPYVPPIQQQNQNDDNQSLSGVWGQLKQEQWQKALYLGQVCTVFNKDMVVEYSNSVWTRRNWLTYHDMVYLSRADIQAQFLATQQSIFYNFLEHIYDNFKSEEKLRVTINHIQDFYYSFPPHLYNNVFLYRKLFVYFKDNNFLSQPFSQFLRRRDEQIFKRIFDHQKHKKGSFLKEIKPIYEQLRQSDKFNNGLLKFFSSNLSEVSDIKYLLNRINNQKRQFHAENQEMYQVLIKGMQIKLRLGSERDIPIEQVLIYINKIPIQDNKFISNELLVLQKLNQQHLNSLFKTMKINLSVFEIIRNRDTVLMKVIQHLINKADLKQHLNQQAISSLSQTTIQNISEVREKVYGKFTDNDIVFMLVVSLMENPAAIPFLPQVLQHLSQMQSLKERPFTTSQLEAAVYYNYRKKTCEKPLYAENAAYLRQIITLLDQQSILKVFIATQLEMVDTFMTAGLSMVYPLCGETGIISKKILQGLIDSLSAEGLLLLDMHKVQSLEVILQKCLGVGEPSISLYELYQKQIICLLKKNHLKQALKQIRILFTVQPTNPDNIVYPVLMFRYISCELIEENKQLMLSLISTLFNHPGQLLDFFEQLTARAYSNDQQKQLLNQLIRGSYSCEDARFNTQNVLIDDTFKQYLKQKPEKCAQVEKLLQMQYAHFLHSNHEYAKSTDLPIINMIALLRPQLLIKYVHRCYGVMNLREVRCYLSYLPKYELFDGLKVLQFAKRLFKILYFCEKDLTNLDSLVAQNLAVSLNEIDNLPLLPADTQNLNKLSKSIQKFRAKLKTKMTGSSLKKRRSESIEVGVEDKKIKFDKILSDFSLYLGSNQYPFADSDRQIERQEVIVVLPYKQPQAISGVFDFKKYLHWMLKRTNQPINYYLNKANEDELETEMKRREDALKLSFCRYNSDKCIKDSAPIVIPAFQKILNQSAAVELSKELVPEGMAQLVHISAIPAVQSSAISAFEFSPIEAEYVEEVFLGTSLLKDDILASVEINAEGKLNFKADLIRNHVSSSFQLEEVVAELLRDIYNDGNVEFGMILYLIEGIHLRFSKYTQINAQFLEIYKKIHLLHKKVTLDVPIRLLLPFEGLKLKDTDSLVLFNLIKESICKHLTQTNILTVSKLLALAFKRQDLNIQQIFKADFMKNTNIVL